MPNYRVVLAEEGFEVRARGEIDIAMLDAIQDFVDHQRSRLLPIVVVDLPESLLPPIPQLSQRTIMDVALHVRMFKLLIGRSREKKPCPKIRTKRRNSGQWIPWRG